MPPAAGAAKKMYTPMFLGREIGQGVSIPSRRHGVDFAAFGHIANRISRQEDVMAQVNNHSIEQVMHGLFPKRVLDTVLDAMTDHEKLSPEVLDNETKSRPFALVILKMLTTAGSLGQSGSGANLRSS